MLISDGTHFLGPYPLATVSFLDEGTTHDKLRDKRTVEETPARVIHLNHKSMSLTVQTILQPFAACN